MFGISNVTSFWFNSKLIAIPLIIKFSSVSELQYVSWVKSKSFVMNILLPTSDKLVSINFYPLNSQLILTSNIIILWSSVCCMIALKCCEYTVSFLSDFKTYISEMQTILNLLILSYSSQVTSSYIVWRIWCTFLSIRTIYTLWFESCWISMGI